MNIKEYYTLRIEKGDVGVKYSSEDEMVILATYSPARTFYFYKDDVPFFIDMLTELQTAIKEKESGH